MNRHALAGKQLFERRLEVADGGRNLVLLQGVMNAVAAETKDEAEPVFAALQYRCADAAPF